MERLEGVSRCAVTMRRHDARHIVTSRYGVTVVRTDGRTNGDLKHRDGKSFTAVTRTRASRFFRLEAIGGAP